jgi:hypothetical protein
MARQDVHFFDVHRPLPHRGDHHAHRQVVLQTANPDLPFADLAGQLVQGEPHVERLVDEPEAREAQSRLVLDRSQAGNLLRVGEANLVGTGRLVHGVMLVRRLHRGTAALTLWDRGVDVGTVSA